MKRVLITLSLVITMFSINFDSKAAITTAIMNGNWNSPFTWSHGVPSCGDTIIIPESIRVTITHNVNLDVAGDPLCAAVRIIVSGSLRFENGRKLTLALGACMSIEIGATVGPSSKGGGASEAIYIGPDRVWQASEGVITGPSMLGCPVLLPVELISFNVNQIISGFQFIWEVASEVDVDYYEIEYSEDGQRWEKLLTKSTLNVEKFNVKYDVEVSKKVNSEIVYFRLSNIDIDGTRKALSTIAQKIKSNSSDDLSIFPNPVINGNSFEILLNENLQSETIILITDQMGKTVLSKILQKSEKGKIVIENGNLNSGTYFVSVLNDKQQLKSKVTII
jgi:hypothetical protein